MMAYLDADDHMFDKTDTTYQQRERERERERERKIERDRETERERRKEVSTLSVKVLSSYFYVSRISQQVYIYTMQGNRQDGYGGVPWMFARLYLVPYSQYKCILWIYDHVTERTQARPFEDEF